MATIKQRQIDYLLDLFCPEHQTGPNLDQLRHVLREYRDVVDACWCGHPRYEHAPEAEGLCSFSSCNCGGFAAREG